MRATGTRRLVVMLSAVDTLAGLGGAVRATGLEFRRVEAIRAQRTRPLRVSGASRAATEVDTLVVTSPHAVGPGLLAWAGRYGRGRTPEVWAAGPQTARRLRAAGFSPVRRGSGLGAAGIAAGIGRGHRTIVHLRSDLAGSGMARSLRALGHRVIDLVGYRVLPRPSAVRRHASDLRRSAVIVLSSPSAVESLRRGLPTRDRRALGRTVPAVVLGARTARAAAAAGFRTVRIAPSADPQRFARFLVRVMTDAAA